MNCLRCTSQVLDERVREGVVIDVCPSCRGVWLDRGELEKLLARLGRARDDEEEDDDDGDFDDGRRARGRRASDEDDDEDDDERHPRRSGDRRRGGWLESLSNMFD